MKTIILQVLHGDGQWSRRLPRTIKTASQLMEKHLIPSVQNYAKRHGYSYRLHRPASLHFQIFAEDDIKNATLEIYHIANTLSHLYDRLILMDCDIYIRSRAPAMPLANAPAAHLYPPDTPAPYMPDEHQFNSGVIVMDSDHASTFYNYLKATKPEPRFTCDQDFFCTWSIKNKVHPLEEKWNYIPNYKLATPLRDAFFIHYAGDAKALLTRHYEPLSFHVNKELLYIFIKNCEGRLRSTKLFQRLRQFKKNRQRGSKN